MRHLLLTILALALLAGTAAAQVTNGTFDSGLTGWATAATLNGSVAWDTFGFPANAARLGATNPPLGLPTGSASIAQSFGCGGSFDEGSCVVSLDYAVASSFGAVIRVEVKLDNNVVWSSDHSSNWSGVIPVSFTAPCGLHNLEVSATYQSGGFHDGWRCWVDNVTAECVPTVAAETEAWGAVKAGYR
ncbi:MAG: hypothetical protein IPH09_00435 [bacterium]|nr:hypothetical protein [bacterium]